MIPKERFSAAAKKSTPDRVPVVYYTLGASEHVLKTLQLNWRDIYWSAEKIAKAMLKACELWGHDNVCSFLSPTCGMDALGINVKVPPMVMPHVDYEVPFLNSEENLENLKIPDPEKDGSMAVRLEAARILNDKIGNKLTLLGGFGGISTWAMFLRGTKKFVRDVKRNPEFQSCYMNFLADRAIEYCLAQVEAGCDWIISAEDAFALELLDPDRAWKANGIYAKRLADAVHKAGAGYILHCCGDVSLSIERMADTGADVLSVDNIDLADAKRRVGGRVGLMGNIKLQTLLYEAPSDVERACKEAIDKAASSGGYLLSSGYIYPANTPDENIKALVRSAEKYGKY